MNTNFLWGAMLLLAMSGCASPTYERMDIKPVSVGGELSGSISSVGASVPVAGVIVARIAPFNSDGKPMAGQVVSNDPNTLQVVPAIGDENYALLGVHPGSTVLHLFADGVAVSSLQATVTAQP